MLARWVRVDLHVHTVLSACAEMEMTPPLIVGRACDLGLAAIAVTDHNSAENASAVQEAAKGTGLEVVPGMEIQTAEEVDLLALFATLDGALRAQERVYAGLGEARNRPEYFGEQIVVDAAGYPLRENDLLLQARTDLSLEAAVELVHRCGGVAVAAHVDRPSRSLLANLGFIPKGLALDGVELSRYARVDSLLDRHPELRGMLLGSFGDAHRLDELGGRTECLVGRAEPEEIVRCFQAGDCSALRITDRTGQVK